jgi:hypothetical protein
MLWCVLFQGRLDAINVSKAVDFVLSCMNFDGGFGCRPGSESHSGQVWFGLRAHLYKPLLSWVGVYCKACHGSVSLFVCLLSDFLTN